MPQTAGFQGGIKIATTASPTPQLGQVNSLDMPLAADVYDVTFMGDRAKDFLSGLYTGTLAAKLNYDKTDAVQAVVEAAFLAGTLLYCVFSPSNFAATTLYTFTAYVKDYKVGNPVNNVVSTDLTFQITAAIVVS